MSSRHRDSRNNRNDSRSERYSGGLYRERSRGGDWDESRGRDLERYDRNRDRSSRDERRKDSDYDCRRSRDDDRRRGRRHRSLLNQRDTPRNRSRSPSRSPSPPSKSKRMSGFDLAPPVAPGAAVAEKLPGTSQTVPSMFQNMLPSVTTQLGAHPYLAAHTMTQQATRHARRVYVGGLPPTANEQTIATFFSHVMAAIGGNSIGAAGDAVVNVYINYEKKFAFVEMRTVEEASNAMALDGITFEGVSVRVRRPTDYNPAIAATLGPSHPNPNLNLAAVGLTPGASFGVEGPDRIFIGGLPYYFTESQMRELLESFGPLRGFDLVKDKDTGNFKGYGFCVYQDPDVTDIACAALNGLKMGDKVLTVRRATASAESKSEQDNILAQAHQHIAMQKMVLQAGGVTLPAIGSGSIANRESPSKVLCLTEAVAAETLRNDQEYQEILEDMQSECSKFGTLVNIVIPRPNVDGEPMPGVGKVFLEYSDAADCATARMSLSGRKFDCNIVCAVYYPEEKYYKSEYDA